MSGYVWFGLWGLLQTYTPNVLRVEMPLVSPQHKPVEAILKECISQGAIQIT